MGAHLSHVRSYTVARLAVVARAAAGILAGLALTTHRAAASTAGAAMPWDGPLDNLVQNLTGPTVRALVIVAVVAAGLLWAFTRHEEGLKRVGQIAFGGAIAIGAVTMMANLGIAGATV